MNRIEQLRKEFLLSQTDLAEKLHVHQTAISQWEKERTMPSFDLLCKMCELFDVDPVYLMGNSDVRGHWPKHDEDEKEPATVEGSGPEINPLYFELSEQDRATVDALIDHLSRAERSAD